MRTQGIRRSIRREPVSPAPEEVRPSLPELTRINLGNLTPKAREAVLDTYYRERARGVLPVTSEDIERARKWARGEGVGMTPREQAPFRLSFERVLTKFAREDARFRQGLSKRFSTLEKKGRGNGNP